MGYGRGATFVVGCWLANQKVAKVTEAVRNVQSKRPGIRLRAE
jgi:protein-tyrosine phosphatase